MHTTEADRSRRPLIHLPAIAEQLGGEGAAHPATRPRAPHPVREVGPPAPRRSRRDRRVGGVGPGPGRALIVRAR
jgi:hypothetical protein